MKLLFYSDSSVYGGHEKTLVDAISSLVGEDNIEVTVIIYRNNLKLRKNIIAIHRNIKIVLLDHKTEPGDVFRALLTTKKVREISLLMKSLAPDMVIVSQGAIGLSACGLKAAHEMCPITISFLPMAHPVSLVRGKNSLDVKIQQILYNKLYHLPRYYITICETTKRLLVNNCKIDSDRILVTYYGLNSTIGKLTPFYDYFKTHRENQNRNIGFVSRVEFNQKQHDKFLICFSNSDLINNCKLYIIGDGPDFHPCKKLVSSLALDHKVEFVGWVDDIMLWYKKLDALVLPSKFEGLPIVVIEAMTYGIPIVAPAIDEMAELLPKSWLFTPNEWGQMTERLNFVLYEDQTDLVRANQKFVSNMLSLDSYQNNFRKAIKYIAAQNPAQ